MPSRPEGRMPRTIAIIPGSSRPRRRPLLSRARRCLRRRRRRGGTRGSPHRGRTARLPVAQNRSGLRDGRAAAGDTGGAGGHPLGATPGLRLSAVARDDARAAEGLSGADDPPGLRLRAHDRQVAAQDPHQPVCPRHHHDGHARPSPTGFSISPHGLKNLERNILRFSGIKPVRNNIVGMIGQLTPEKADAWLAKIRARGQRGV